MRYFMFMLLAATILSSTASAQTTPPDNTVTPNSPKQPNHYPDNMTKEQYEEARKKQRTEYEEMLKKRQIEQNKARTEYDKTLKQRYEEQTKKAASKKAKSVEDLNGYSPAAPGYFSGGKCQAKAIGLKNGRGKTLVCQGLMP